MQFRAPFLSTPCPFFSTTRPFLPGKSPPPLSRKQFGLRFWPGKERPGPKLCWRPCRSCIQFCIFRSYFSLHVILTFTQIVAYLARDTQLKRSHHQCAGAPRWLQTGDPMLRWTRVCTSFPNYPSLEDRGTRPLGWCTVAWRLPESCQAQYYRDDCQARGKR